MTGRTQASSTRRYNKQKQSKQKGIKHDNHRSWSSFAVSMVKACCFMIIGGYIVIALHGKVMRFLYWSSTQQTLGDLDPKQREMFSYLKHFVCDAVDPKTGVKNGYCHPALVPNVEHRTHSVMNLEQYKIDRNEILLVLPRHLLISDLDALRDEYIYNELLGAQHMTDPKVNAFIEEMWPYEIKREDYYRDNDYRTQMNTKNYIDMGGYLAAYLARRIKLSTVGWLDTKTGKKVYGENANQTVPSNVNDPLLPFFKILPTYDELAKHHPTLWEQNFLDEQFGEMSNVKQQVYAFRDMIIGEYLALCRKSKEFCVNVSPKEFKAYRINVLSRAFGMGPISNALTKDERNDPFFKSLDLNMLENANIFLRKGIRAMSPILDMWDHHPDAQTAWRYMQKDEAFVVSSIGKGLYPGQDVMVSYGTYTDTHLFCKFGFSNGDGSGDSEASVASRHRTLTTGLEPQFSYLPTVYSGDYFYQGNVEDVLDYLNFDDDGGQFCATPDDKVRWSLKMLKVGYMLALSSNRTRWTLKTSWNKRPPYIPKNSYPHFEKLLNVHFDNLNRRTFLIRGEAIQDITQIVSLSTADYKGRSIQVLASRIGVEHIGTFSVDVNAFPVEALHYRSLFVYSRWLEMAMEQYPNSYEEEKNLFKTLTETKYQSREWTASRVRLSELDALSLLRINIVNNIQAAISDTKKDHRRDLTNPKEQGMFRSRTDKCPILLYDKMKEDLPKYFKMFKNGKQLNDHYFSESDDSCSSSTQIDPFER